MTRVARLAGLWSLVVAVTASTALLIPGCATEKSSHTPAPAPTPTPPPPTPTPHAGTTAGGRLRDQPDERRGVHRGHDADRHQRGGHVHRHRAEPVGAGPE